MENGAVDYTINEGIANIRFWHPKSNSLPSSVLSKLAKTITDLGNKEEVKLIILSSEGDRAFCAGASFDELISIENFEGGKEFFMGFARVINAARKCPKLIIGRVQGKAVGGGVGMASACDYSMATKYASVKLSELAIGIGPFVVGPAVQRKIGLSAMSELAINATEWRDASWAREKGLYTEVYDDIESLDEGIKKLSDKLVNSNPEAMAKLKSIFWEDCDHWDELLENRAAMSGQLVLSEFTRNAIASFKAK